MHYKTILASFMLTIMILVPTKTHASISLPQQVTTQNLALATAVCSTTTLATLYKSFEQECSKNQRIKTEGFATFVKKFIINKHVRREILKKYPAVKIALAASGLFGTATVAKLSHDLLYKSKKIKEKKNKNNKQEHQKVIATLTDEATKVMDAWQTTRQEETTAFNTILKQMEHEKSLALQKEADRKTAEEARQAAERQTAEQTRIQQEKEQRAETERQEAERQAIEQARIQQEEQQRILTLTEHTAKAINDYSEAQQKEYKIIEADILEAIKNSAAEALQKEQSRIELEKYWEQVKSEGARANEHAATIEFRARRSEEEFNKKIETFDADSQKQINRAIEDAIWYYLDKDTTLRNWYNQDPKARKFEILKNAFAHNVKYLLEDIRISDGDLREYKKGNQTVNVLSDLLYHPISADELATKQQEKAEREAAEEARKEAQRLQENKLRELAQEIEKQAGQGQNKRNSDEIKQKIAELTADQKDHLNAIFRDYKYSNTSTTDFVKKCEHALENIDGSVRSQKSENRLLIIYLLYKTDQPFPAELEKIIQEQADERRTFERKKAEKEAAQAALNTYVLNRKKATDYKSCNKQEKDDAFEKLSADLKEEFTKVSTHILSQNVYGTREVKDMFGSSFQQRYVTGKTKKEDDHIQQVFNNLNANKYRNEKEDALFKALADICYSGQA